MHASAGPPKSRQNTPRRRPGKRRPGHLRYRRQRDRASSVHPSGTAHRSFPTARCRCASGRGVPVPQGKVSDAASTALTGIGRTIKHVLGMRASAPTAQRQDEDKEPDRRGRPHQLAEVLRLGAVIRSSKWNAQTVVLPHARRDASAASGCAHRRRRRHEEGVRTR